MNLEPMTKNHNMKFYYLGSKKNYKFSFLFQYDAFDALEKDFMLLCANTQKYNEDGSLIHEVYLSS